MVQIRLLGGVGAQTDDGRAIDIGPEKCRALLAALALSTGKPVPVSRLVEQVWGAQPPRTAEKTLQTYVGRLRRGLGAEAITRVGAAYRLEASPDDVDVARFQSHLAAGRVPEALAEWTGPPLPGVSSEGLAPAVDRLVEQWLSAVETDLARRVDADAASVIATLTEHTAAHPYREELWALLMTALYRVGRQADALTAFQSLRRRLDEDLGVEPGPRVQALQRSILDQDETLQGPPDRRPATPAPPGTEGRTLPHRPGRLLGRQDDVATITAALATAPVVSLTGPGGIGKTRLALAVAETIDTPAGPWLVELAEITSPGDVARAVAQSLGVHDGAARPLVEAIVAALASRQGLLVLDNCEHVIDAAAGLVQAVVEGAPGARVLATSREGLGVEGERLVPVDPLDPEAAVTLFAERARALDADFDARAERRAVEEICRRLDGLPLAIELAAARTRVLAPDEIVERLGDHLELLVGGRRTAASRHQTLRAAIQWSYRLLTPSQQRLFARLSVFAGSFDLHAVTRVAADPDLEATELADLLGALVDRSLVVSDAHAGTRRFHLLEPIRQFAAAALDEGGHTSAVSDRHSRWCLEEVSAIEPLLAGPDEAEGVDRLRLLLPNLRIAVRRACEDGEYELGYALVRPIVGESLLRSAHEVGDWIEMILAVTPPEEEGLRVLGLAWACQRYASAEDPHGYEALLARFGPLDHLLVRHARAFVGQDYQALLELAPATVAEWRRRGEDHLAELTEPDLGAALLNLGRLDEHDVHVGALVERYRRQGPPTLLNWTLMLMGYSALFAEDQERADWFFGEALDVAVPARTHSPSRAIEARSAFRRGERRRAFEILRDHVEELLETGNMQGASVAAVEFLHMMVAEGRLDDAARSLAYLQGTGLLNAPGFARLVSDAATALDGLALEGGDTPAPTAVVDDDRAAMAHMLEVLGEMLVGPPAQPTVTATLPRA